MVVVWVYLNAEENTLFLFASISVNGKLLSVYSLLLLLHLIFVARNKNPAKKSLNRGTDSYLHNYYLNKSVHLAS